MINMYRLPYFHVQIYVRLAYLFLLCLGTTFIELAIYINNLTGNKKERVVFGESVHSNSHLKYFLQGVADKLRASLRKVLLLLNESIWDDLEPVEVNNRPIEWCQN